MPLASKRAADDDSGPLRKRNCFHPPSSVCQSRPSEARSLLTSWLQLTILTNSFQSSPRLPTPVSPQKDHIPSLPRPALPPAISTVYHPPSPLLSPNTLHSKDKTPVLQHPTSPQDLTAGTSFSTPKRRQTILPAAEPSTDHPLEAQGAFAQLQPSPPPPRHPLTVVNLRRHNTILHSHGSQTPTAKPAGKRGFTSSVEDRLYGHGTAFDSIIPDKTKIDLSFYEGRMSAYSLFENDDGAYDAHPALKEKVNNTIEKGLLRDPEPSSEERYRHIMRDSAHLNEAT